MVSFKELIPPIKKLSFHEQKRERAEAWKKFSKIYMQPAKNDPAELEKMMTILGYDPARPKADMSALCIVSYDKDGKMTIRNLSHKEVYLPGVVA